ncbi:phage tail protein [Mucilaginibacter sp. AW1-3]
MANSDKPDVTWPGPYFMFMVDFGTAITDVPFQHVSGFDSETQPPEYRTHNTPQLATVKMPAMAGMGIVTLKRGIFVNNDIFGNWVAQIRMNTVPKTTVVIKLLNDAKAVTMQWTLNNARPVKITDTDMKAAGNEVAVETIEIAYEQLVISNGK